MKYIDSDKLIAKIQPLYEEAKDKSRFAGQTGTSSDCTKWDKAVWIYEHILHILLMLFNRSSLERSIYKKRAYFEISSFLLISKYY